MNLEYKYKNKEFIVCPESGHLLNLKNLAKETGKFVIGGFQVDLGTKVALINPEGEILDQRFKAVHPGFRDHSKDKTDKIRPFYILTKEVEFGGRPITVLPLICYEIIFPKLWTQAAGVSNVNFVTHHVGSPMFDIFQLEGWRALQEMVGLLFDCDIICSCGGKKSPMNLSGIIKTKDSIRNYNNLYKKYGGGHTL